MKVLLLLVGTSCALYSCSKQDSKTPPIPQSSQTVDDSTLSDHVKDVTMDSIQDSSSIPPFTFPMPPPPPKIIGCFWLVDEKDEQYDFEPDMDRDHSQSKDLDSSIEYYTDLIPAHFPGGNELLPGYLREHLHYPADLKEQGIEGSVYVKFTILRSGKVSDIHIVKGFAAEADSICARMFRQMPLWTPAKQNKRPVEASYTLPIRFKLSDETHERVDSDRVSTLIAPSFYSLIPSSSEPEIKQSTAAIDAIQKGQPMFDLYPNPATRYCHISVVNYSADMQYTIFTLSGQMLVQERLTSASQKIDLQNLAAGNYFIEVNSRDARFKTTQQFSVQ